MIQPRAQVKFLTCLTVTVQIFNWDSEKEMGTKVPSENIINGIADQSHAAV